MMLGGDINHQPAHEYNSQYPARPRSRPGSAGSRRSARSAKSARSATSRASSRDSRRSAVTTSGLSPQRERRREAGFDARSTATEQMNGIPEYDALRDKNLPAVLKDKLLRNAYSAQAHSRRQRAQVKAARPGSAGRPTSAGRSRRPSSAGRRTRPGSAGRRGSSSSRVAANTQLALEPVRARIAELWEELRIPERERRYYAALTQPDTSSLAADTLMRLRDALEGAPVTPPLSPSCFCGRRWHPLWATLVASPPPPPPCCCLTG
jgi:hypothetical protein